ncbi:MAG: cupin domain-containing protein [Fusobacteriota bacterium]
MEIKIKDLTEKEVEKKGIRDWPIWNKEVSKFDWHYDQVEECLILEGEVEVTPKGGDPVHIEPGDFVVFPKGMDCVWNIKKNIKKHYKFK